MNQVDVPEGDRATVSAVRESDFPALYLAADSASLEGQRRYLRVIRLQLLSLGTAAAFGVFTWRVDEADLAGVVAAVAFGVFLVSEVYLLRDQPARAWYGGRALAESAKTLTWRYLVGGHPFALDGDDADSARLFRQRLGELTRDVPGVWLVGPTEHGHASAAMRHARSLPLDQRRDLYLTHRIHNQVDWYSQKAVWNKRRANAWSIALAALTTVGLTAGVIKAAGIVDVDILGLTAALVASGGTWIQLKQHHNLVSAYSVAQHELALIAEDAVTPRTETDWASFVASAEDAVSREHTLWRASRW